MNYFLGTVLVFFLSELSATAQTTSALEPCSCLKDFNDVVDNVSVNYPGFNDKVTATTKPRYDALTQRLREEARRSSSEDCLPLLQEWIAFFKDHHLSIGSAAPPVQFDESRPQSIRDYFSKTETIKLSEEDFKTYLAKNASTLDAIEGVWESQSGNYRVALVRNQTPKRDFAGVILRADSVYWVPGQVKLEFAKRSSSDYSATVYLRDHSKDRMNEVFPEDRELRLNGFIWRKVFPERPVALNIKPTSAEGSERVPPLPKLSFKRLSDSTVLLRIPSFDGALYKETDSIIQANRAIILSTPNLIVDIRNNGGGSSMNYRELLPMLYTDPIIGYASYVYVTDENIKYYEELSTNVRFRADTRAWASGILKRIVNAPRGTYICKNVVPTDTTRFSQVMPYPKRVAVLINKGCASSAENFVNDAKFSKKVTLFGENTGGLFDYGEIYSRNLPCGTVRLHCPTAAQPQHLPRIDNIGFSPDVRIDASVGDWVKFARQALESKGLENRTSKQK